MEAWCGGFDPRLPDQMSKSRKLFAADLPPKGTNHSWKQDWVQEIHFDGRETQFPWGWRCKKCGLFASPAYKIKENDKDCDSRVVKQVMEEI